MGEEVNKKYVRAPRHAGTFYPSEEKELSKMISKLLSKSKPKKVSEKLRALIVPHAGYIYSGPVAAFAYNLVKEVKPKRIILSGPSHYDYLQGAFGFRGEWKTPLGVKEVINPSLDVIQNDEEHSLEVQLPFLQSVLTDFDFIPILYGDMDPSELGFILEELNNKDSVIIASSDLSHYLSYEKAIALDKASIDSILKLDLKKFLELGDACGKIGVLALIFLAKKNNWKAVLLDYKNSGDTSTKKSGGVVGYTSIAFIEK